MSDGTDKKPKVELEDLSVSEGGIVDRGDNPPAHVAYFKRVRDWAAAFKARVVRKDPPTPIAMPGPVSTEQVLARDTFSREFMTLKLAFMESVGSILSAAPSQATGEMLRKTVDEFAARAGVLAGGVSKADAAEIEKLAVVMRETADAEVAGVDKREQFAIAITKLDEFNLTPAAPAVGTSAGGGESAPNTESSAMKKIEDVMKGLSADDRAVLDAEIAKTKADAVAEVAKAKAAQGEVSASETVRKEMEDLRKRNEAAEARVKKLEDDQLTTEYVAKAKALDAPGVDPADLGDVLKWAHTADAARGKKLDGIIASLSTQARKGLALMTSRVGKVGAAGDGSADSLISKAAAEYRKADPKLTEQQAVTKALEADPALYDRWNTENTAH